MNKNRILLDSGLCRRSCEDQQVPLVASGGKAKVRMLVTVTDSSLSTILFVFGEYLGHIVAVALGLLLDFLSGNQQTSAL